MEVAWDNVHRSQEKSPAPVSFTPVVVTVCDIIKIAYENSHIFCGTSCGIGKMCSVFSGYFNNQANLPHTKLKSDTILGNHELKTN